MRLVLNLRMLVRKHQGHRGTGRERLYLDALQRRPDGGRQFDGAYQLHSSVSVRSGAMVLKKSCLYGYCSVARMTLLRT
jgi:hypothetical protein